MIGILGFGKMGEAIVQGSRSNTFMGTVRSKERADTLSEKLNLSITTDNLALTKKCRTIVLSVKPFQVEAVLKQIRPRLTPQHHLISICAGVTLEQLATWTQSKCAITRAMPNTPCVIQSGVTVLSFGSKVKAPQRDLARALFSELGAVLELEDKHLDAVTGLSSCGPAYAYLILESLADAGVKVGLPRDIAMQLAARTLAGSAKMVLELGAHPAALKDDVTTPGGCTIDGLMALEEGRVRVSLIKAVVAATQRSKSLREENSAK